MPICLDSFGGQLDPEFESKALHPCDCGRNSEDSCTSFSPMRMKMCAKRLSIFQAIAQASAVRKRILHCACIFPCFGMTCGSRARCWPFREPSDNILALHAFRNGACGQGRGARIRRSPELGAPLRSLRSPPESPPQEGSTKADTLHAHYSMHPLTSPFLYNDNAVFVRTPETSEDIARIVPRPGSGKGGSIRDNMIDGYEV